MEAIERSLRTKHLLLFNFLFWILLTLLEIIRTLSLTKGFGLPWEASLFIRWPVAPFLSYWVLSYFVFHAYTRLRKLQRRRFLVFHLLGSLAFALIHALLAPVVALLLERLVLRTETLGISQVVQSFTEIRPDLLIGMAVYWVMIAVVSGINFYRKYLEASEKARDLEAMLTSSQLHTMKMQMQPHFLFNAFNTISMMVRRGEKERSVDMISNLSDMLRESLSQDKQQFVTLQKEVTVLEKYLSIETARYSDRLTLDMHIDPAAHSVLIPNMLLQPLVENAFKHGISKNLEKSILKIRVTKADDQLHVYVFNSGSALPPGWEFNKNKGIGLLNTSTRLLKLYQKPVKFLINEKDGGVAVEITLPIND